MTDVAVLSASRAHRAISTQQNVSLQAKTLFIGLGVSHALVLCIMWGLGGNPSPYISLTVQSFGGVAGISCLYQALVVCISFILEMQSALMLLPFLARLFWFD
jgi:hypothetical protein